jgi:rare lipoprotein A
MGLVGKHRRGIPRLRSLFAVLLLAAAGALGACSGPQTAPAPNLALQQPPLPSVPPTVYPSEVPSFSQIGLASWYGSDFHHKTTASGERYDMHDMTAAHRSLPLDTLVRVTNLSNHRSVVVRINDRGPFAHGRVIDLSRSAAERLGMTKAGVAPVRIDVFDADQPNTVAQYQQYQANTVAQYQASTVAEYVAP